MNQENREGLDIPNDQWSQDLLAGISSPKDVKRIPETCLPELAREIRARMVDVVSKNGGHLAPSLGTVELTLALCRVFDFPKDKVIWDVGHQAYAWKMVTGRNAKMETLRKFRGLRGFPCPTESPYDAFVGGHAGVALSAALGMAAARDAAHRDENIIAVVGDASLTNGISLEAINAVRHTTNRLILVINDNGMSISRNIGAFARLFARSLSGLRYNRIRAMAEATGHRLRLNRLASFYRHVKGALKALVLRHRAAIFEDLGLRYIGPIDGHNISALCAAFRAAQEGHVPVALHIATIKGKGYAPAERNPAKWHGVAPWGEGRRIPPGMDPCSWSMVFGQALLRHADDARVVAITAAMRDGTGLAEWFRRFPERAYDVGICEAHAVAFAAGLASAGLRPVVALYSTFAQRAVDDIMHDVCLQQLPVVFCLDRAGVVGADGPTHHGLYDLAMLRALPNLTIVAPATQQQLALALDTALKRNGPTVIRYPRGIAPQEISVGCAPSMPVQAHLLALGDTAGWLGDALAGLPVQVHVVESVKPLPPECDIWRNAAMITLENAAATAGFGSAVAETHKGPLLILGWPDAFIPQGTEAELRTACGLDSVSIRHRVQTFLNAIQTRELT